MAYIVDSYSESNQDGYTSLLYEGGAIGQSFTAGNGLLSSAKVYLEKYGSPTGNVSLKIYEHSGTYGTNSIPTGSPLATSETLDVSTLSTSYELKTFNFTGANRIALSSQYYVLVISGGVYDGSNRLIIGEDESSSSHSGTMSSYEYDGESETWSWISTEGYGSYDMCFYVYADRLKTFTADGLIKNILTKTFTTNGSVLSANLKTFTADGLIGNSRYYLDNNFIPSPSFFSRDFIQTRQYLKAINGKESVDIGNRKEKYTLQYDRLTQNESATIINIVNKNEPILFRIANGSFILNNTYVLPEITKIEYARSGDYMSKIELILTEVK